MGALDEFTDPQLAALTTLVVGAVRAELGAAAVVAGYTWPIGSGRSPELRLPAIAIYSLSERTRRRTMRGPIEHEVTFRFDYVASATALDRMQERWPLLRAVWKQTVLAVQAGQHTAVSANAEILSAAGIVSIDRESPQVRYLAPTTEDVHPRFEGTMVLKHADAYDRSTLALFLGLAGAINRDDGNTAIQPQVSFLADANDA